MTTMPWWVPLFATLIGGGLAIAGGVLTEMFKQRNQRRGLALALRGEMLAIIKIVEIRRYEPALVHASQLLRNGQSVHLPPIRIERNYFPIYEENASKIGLLPPEIAERIAKAYVYANSFIEDATMPRTAELHPDAGPLVEQLREVLGRALQEAQEASDLIEKEFIRKC